MCVWPHTPRPAVVSWLNSLLSGDLYSVAGTMTPGLTFTIEPMLVAAGGSTRPRIEADGWTAYTADRSLTAQYEHTVLITDTGVEVLTLLPGTELPAQ